MCDLRVNISRKMEIKGPVFAWPGQSKKGQVSGRLLLMELSPAPCVFIAIQ